MILRGKTKSLVVIKPMIYSNFLMRMAMERLTRKSFVPAAARMKNSTLSSGMELISLTQRLNEGSTQIDKKVMTQVWSEQDCRPNYFWNEITLH